MIAPDYNKRYQERRLVDAYNTNAFTVAVDAWQKLKNLDPNYNGPPKNANGQYVVEGQPKFSTRIDISPFPSYCSGGMGCPRPAPSSGGRRPYTEPVSGGRRPYTEPAPPRRYGQRASDENTIARVRKQKQRGKRYDTWENWEQYPGENDERKQRANGKRYMTEIVPVKVSEFGNPMVNASAFGEADFGSEYAFLSYAKKLKPIPVQRKQKPRKGKTYRRR